MTGKELLYLSLSLMAEPKESESDYNSYSLSAINVLIAECFEINNSILNSKQQESLLSSPYILTLEDDIPYDLDLFYTCLSYGLAAKLILEDNDLSKFNYFNSMYVQGMQSNTKAINGKIDDLYGGD